jgi:hypothetical protein
MLEQKRQSQRRAAFDELAAIAKERERLPALRQQVADARREADRLAAELAATEAAIRSPQDSAARAISETADPIISEAVSAVYRELQAIRSATVFSAVSAKRIPALTAAVHQIGAIAGEDYGDSARAEVVRLCEPLGVNCGVLVGE